MNILKNYYHSILSILFPNKCLGCFSYFDSKVPFCPKCFNNLTKYYYFICPTCNKNFELDNPNFCDHPTDFKIKAIFHALDFKEEATKNIVHHFKYNHLFSLVPLFSNIFSLTLNNHKQYLSANEYILLPIPLHKMKQRQRGFNQSLILSQILSKVLNIPYYDNILIRFKNNPAQAQIKNKDKRIKNVENIFKINPKYLEIIENKNIILVDDVYTTGSTLNECAKILKHNHVKTILGICLAK